MTLHWSHEAWKAAIVIVGCGVTYVAVLRRIRKMLSKTQRELEHRLAALTEAIAMRESLSSGRVPATDALTAADTEGEEVSALPEFPAAEVNVSETRLRPQEQEEGEIAPQIEAAIAAAAIAAFGNHARVRSARRVPSSDVVSPWTQQGRVIVQSSHNLRIRGQ